MATFGEFLRTERDKKGLNQSDFGQEVGVIMTDLSKIENGHKKFPYSCLQKLAEFLKKDIEELKNLYVADILVEKAHKFNCSDSVFSIAESQSKYVKNKSAKQGKLEF